MLDSSFYVDDDFTVDVIEEPEEKSDEEVNTQDVESPGSFVVTGDISGVETKSELETISEEKKPKDSSGEAQKKSDENSVVKDESSDKNLPLPTFNKKSTFECSKCTYTTDRYAAFLSHIDGHLEDQRLYKCKSCNFATFIKGHFTIHQAHCNYAHKVFCNQCNFVTTKHKNLRMHVNNAHGNRCFKCRRCPFETMKKEEYLQHCKEQHPRSRYKCELCDFETRLKEVLCRHVKTHFRHKCEVCDFQHPNKKIIRSHMRIHHKIGVKTVALKKAEGSVAGQIGVEV